MRDEVVAELLRIGAITIFKAVVATTVAHYTKRFLVERDAKAAAAKKRAATAAN